MSVPCKFERSLISHDEWETVRTTHHPVIYDLDIKQLAALQVRLRGMRDKEKTLARQKSREMRGKAEPRGGSHPGIADLPRQRKQVFAAALRRVGAELDRMRKLEARATQGEAARRALALRRAASFTHHPAAGDTAHDGARPITSKRVRAKVPPARIGSISQATKVAQAVRDSRG